MVAVEAQLAETVTVKACNACRGGLLERDKFCRWCGSPQTHSLDCQDQRSSLSLSPYTTSALNQVALNQAALASRPYGRVSGPLVRALVESVSGGRSTEPAGRVVRSIVQALVSIPIWLMIVLLSPIDAYVAAKSISRQF
ncbi:MAG TPA: hypothetical protein VFO63_03305 [Blastocatellia bacterium]|nr:hypothetical protein [Blastocatellia bacterium]